MAAEAALDHDTFWTSYLNAFETSEFPDLTGSSSSARKQLSGFTSNQLLIHNIDTKAISEEDPNAIFQAAWCKILATYTGETDVCFGFQNFIDGTAIEPLPIRIKFESSTTNQHFLRIVNVSHRAISNRKPPSSKVLESICGPQNAQLYDTALLISPTSLSSFDLERILPSVRILCQIVILDRSSFLLHLHCQRAVIPPKDTQHVLDLVNHALTSLTQFPSSPISSFDVTNSIVWSISNPDPLPAPSTDGIFLHSAAEHNAEASPDAVALDFLEDDATRTQWTFAALVSKARKVAHALVTLNHIGVDEPVPICIAKSPAYYAGVLGVLMAGGAFVPFDPKSPTDRKRSMMEELAADIVLCTDESDAEAAWIGNAKILNVTSILRNGLEIEDKDRPTLSDSNLAYLMYTSGSTGRPKAVSIEHRNAVQTAQTAKSLIPWTKNSRMLQYSGPTFDMCYFDVFFAWSAGICLCAASQDSLFNNLTAVVNKLDISMLGLTPSVAMTLERQQLPRVEWLYCIGEALPQSLVDIWEDKLMNSYGPTEAAQMVTLFPVRKHTKSAVIGKPFMNTSFTVVQKGSNSVAPVMGIGELCIGGYQVGRGYYMDSAKTQTAFINFNGQRLYKTGDNVRMLSNGTFEFIGRTDDQVKIRGQRVELGEINAILKGAHPGIRSVSSHVLRINENTKDQLVAFIVSDPTSDRSLILAAAQTQATRSLVEYMVPKAVLFVERLPLSPAGKIDKRALAAVFRESGKHDESEDGVSSASENWSLLCHIISDMAGISSNNISRKSSIYHLGLDSLSAIQLAARLNREVTGLSIQASDIMSNPTLQQLDSFISKQEGLATTEDAEIFSFNFAAFDAEHRSQVCTMTKLQDSSISRIRPCTSLQMGMIAQSLHSGGDMYFIVSSYLLEQNVNLKQLSYAWKAITAKHDILRSGFVELPNARQGFTMVTYRPGVMQIPVETTHNHLDDLKTWKTQCIKNAMGNLHLPPWKARVESGMMYIFMHHALYDGQVLDVLFKDLQLAYRGSTLCSQAPLEQQISRILVHDVDTGAAAKYWKETGKHSVSTRTMTMSPMLVEKSSCGSTAKTISRTTAELRQGCQAAGITIQAAGQAAWGLILSAYTGEDSVTFGTVMSGRVTNDSVEVAFPCINTVPTTYNRHKSRQENLNALMTFNAQMQKYQFTPLAKIQRWAGCPEGALFDSIFTYQKSATPQKKNSPWIYCESDLAIDYSISVELEPVDDEHIQFRIAYRQDRIPDEQAILLLDQLEITLQGVIDGGKQITMGNANPHLYSMMPAQMPFIHSDSYLLHQFVENSAVNVPEKVALEWVTNIHDSGVEKQTWTYAQLNSEGNRVANMLRAQDIPQGSIVAICFDKCPEASFAMLGILKAGCAFLALDPGAPDDRKRFILDDTNAPILLTKGSAMASLLGSLVLPIFNFEKDSLDGFSTASPLLDRPIDPHGRSYVLFTSGTTGKPKGCELTHENAVQVMLAFQTLYKWTDDSRWLQFSGYHFDVCIMEQYFSWSVGICLVSASRDLILEDLAATLRNLKITHVDLTPSLAGILTPEEVPDLTRGVFITGGEMLKREIVQAFGPYECIYNAYGPTETSIGVTMWPRLPLNGRPSNIGWQFPNVGTFVVEPNDPKTPVLRGAVGELCIAGPLVAKGYVNRPELTAEKFITIAGQRCYRTGDLVRLLHDGSFDFLGRADSQVKLRGQRLEIGEINAVIREYSKEVLDVTTLVVKHPNQQKAQLVTFLVLQATLDKHAKPKISLGQGTSSTLADVRRACAEKLPGYMIPTYFVPVSQMPLSANNKVEEKQLKALFEELTPEAIFALFSIGTTVHSSSSLTSAADRKKITQIIGDTLSISLMEISDRSSIFELGLDSISVIRFTRSLKANGYQTATTSLVMANPTLSGLARALGSRSEETSEDDSSVRAAKQEIAAAKHRYKAYAASSLAIPSSNVESIAPCTPLQEGIIISSLESGKNSYFLAFRFDLNQDVDLGKLRSAYHDVVRQAQVLRTSFLPTDNGYIQVVQKEMSLPWREVMATENSLDAKVTEVHGQWRAFNTYSFLRPFEAVIIRTPERSVLCLHMFHGIYDGSSLPLLSNSILSEYHGDAKPSYGPPFHDALPYGPLRKQEGAQSFWIDHLKPMSRLGSQVLPSLLMNSAGQDCTFTRKLRLPETFESVRRKLNVTHQALIQACWTVVLYATFSTPLVLGMVVSGRSIDFDEAEKVIGPLFNTVPFLLKIKQNATWRNAVAKCHEFNVMSLPFQQTALRDIQKWTKQLRRVHDGSILETLFVFQKRSESNTPKHDPIWQPRETSFEANYPLAVEVEQSDDDSLSLTVVSQAYMADEITLRKLAGKFEMALACLAGDIDSRVSDVFDTPDFHANNSEILAIPLSNGTNGHTKALESHSAADIQWTPMAEKIRDVIASLADMDGFSIELNTSILELGLDSVDAVKLSSRLRRTAHIQLSVSAIMKGLTIEKLAASAVQETNGSDRQASQCELETSRDTLYKYLMTIGVELSELEDILPPTPLQEGMVGEMIGSDFAQYFNHDIVQLSSETDLERLKAAWQLVYDSSPILRTRFLEVEDPAIEYSIAQLVYRPSRIDWRDETGPKVQDFRVIQCLLDNITNDVRARIDTIPAFRLTLLVDETRKQRYLILSLAHALYDGLSISLLHQDVMDAYDGQYQPRPPYDQALSRILNASGDHAVTFWREQLFDSTPTIFSKSISLVRPHTKAIHRMEKPSQFPLKAIEAFCRTSSTTIAALAQTVWAFCLASYTEQLDVVFGTVLSCRDDEDTVGILFPTMNTVVCRSVLQGTRRNMVQYTQEIMGSISAFQHFPLSKAQGFADRSGSGALFNTLFVYQKRVEQKSGGSQRLYKSIAEVSDTEYPICVEAEIFNNQFVWRIACKNDYVDDAAAAKLMSTLHTVLEAVIEDSNKPAVEIGGGQTRVCGLDGFGNRQVPGSSKTSLENGQLSHDTVWTPVKMTLRNVIARVARVDESAIKENSGLANLGLDSISAIKVSSLLRKESIQLSVSDLLKTGTVWKMAELLEQRSHVGNGHETITLPTRIHEGFEKTMAAYNVHDLLAGTDLEPKDVNKVLPATAGQVYLLSNWQNTGLFFPSLRFEVSGSTDLKALQNAWSTLVRDMSILRTLFVGSGDKKIPIVQVVLVAQQAKICEIGEGDTFDAAISAYLKMEHKILPPAIMFAKQRSSQKIDVALKISHACYDGFSLPLLINRLITLINYPHSMELEEGLSFATYLSTTVRKSTSRRDFWTAHLSDLKRYPLLPVREAASSRRIRVVKTDVLSQVDTIVQGAYAEGLGVESIFLAALATAYAAMVSCHNASPFSTEEADVLIGVFIANRHIEGADELAAPTLSFVPLRIKAPLASEIVEMAKRVQADLRSISEQPERAGVGLWELEEWCGEDAKVDCWVNFLRQDDSADVKGRVRIMPAEETKDKDIAFDYEADIMEEDVSNGLLLKNNAVRNVYGPCIDIEATIKNGKMNIGVLGPELLLDFDGAKDIISGVCVRLEAYAQSCDGVVRRHES